MQFPKLLGGVATDEERIHHKQERQKKVDVLLDEFCLPGKPGHKLKPFFDEMMQKLAVPHSDFVVSEETLNMLFGDGQVSLLPSFFQCVQSCLLYTSDAADE